MWTVSFFYSRTIFSSQKLENAQIIIGIYDNMRQLKYGEFPDYVFVAEKFIFYKPKDWFINTAMPGYDTQENLSFPLKTPFYRPLKMLP